MIILEVYSYYVIGRKFAFGIIILDRANQMTKISTVLKFNTLKVSQKN